ncbi:MAG TPA: TonB C-terminal domain-containing protein [Burkholderiales bacterium]|nr:TonB C-terminal domain-containing protein [Burkholderiales bacterium]
MIAYAYATPGEKTISGTLTLLMHVLLLVMLVIGVSWQKRQTQPMVAELWSSLPPPPAPKVEAPPPPKAVVEPPKPEPPKPVAKPEPKPEPKADISLKEKKEKALKEKALKEKALKEKKELAEKKKKEEQARLEALKLQQAKEAEERRVREQEEALKKLAQQQAAARAQLVDEHKRRIAEHIKRFIIEPPSLQGNPEVELHVTVLVTGAVFEVKTRRASGQALWDSAVQRAVEKASPLPLPPDPALMREFRELNLKFRPKE